MALCFRNNIVAILQFSLPDLRFFILKSIRLKKNTENSFLLVKTTLLLILIRFKISCDFIHLQVNTSLYKIVKNISITKYDFMIFSLGFVKCCQTCCLVFREFYI